MAEEVSVTLSATTRPHCTLSSSVLQADGLELEVSNQNGDFEGRRHGIGLSTD